MITSVSLDETLFAALPQRFEAGTPAVGDAVAWDAALGYIESVGFENMRRHEEELSRYLHEQLLGVKGLRLVGDYFPGKPGIASFTMDCAHPHDIAQFLNEEGVAVRAGFHCAEPLHTALGCDSSVRASLYLYNSREDVDQLISALGTVCEVFG
jgi:cysteine desulfurase/selenocysteine lyase